MSVLTSLFPKSDSLMRSQPHELSFFFQITAAKTIAPLPLISYPILVGFDAPAMTQALVEGFLGHTSSAPCATIFDATSLGTDAVGFVFDMNGGCGTVLGMRVTNTQTAGGTPANASLLVPATQGGLVATSLTSAISTYDGDIYGRIVAGNLDSTTTGFLSVTIYFRSK